MNLLDRIWVATMMQRQQRAVRSSPTSGIVNAKVSIDSGAERSGIQPGMNSAPRSSKWLLSRLYRAKKTGICSSRGRHPDSGFTFSFLYSAAISWFILSGLSFRRARISVILGLSAAILAMDSELLNVSGQEHDLGDQREEDDGDRRSWG